MATEIKGDEKPKLKRKQCQTELRRLQVELCKLQEWVNLNGSRIMVVLEGRDATGTVLSSDTMP
jgi:polyphosphate kinase